jgi:hypothetical protein
VWCCITQTKCVFFRGRSLEDDAIAGILMPRDSDNLIPSDSGSSHSCTKYAQKNKKSVKLNGFAKNVAFPPSRIV